MTTETLKDLRALGDESEEQQRIAIQEQVKARQSHFEVTKLMLAELLAGADLEDIAHAAFGGDQPLTYRERKELVNALCEVPERIVYPDPLQRIAEQDRPGQAWTADEGDGIKPDTPAPIDQPIETKYLVRGIDSQPPFWYSDPAGESVTTDPQKAQRFDTEEAASDAAAEGYTVESVQVNLG